MPGMDGFGVAGMASRTLIDGRMRLRGYVRRNACLAHGVNEALLVVVLDLRANGQPSLVGAPIQHGDGGIHSGSNDQYVSVICQDVADVA